MTKTLKVRKCPADSATKFNLGKRKKGNDGNMWKIVQNKNGVKRWLKISKNKTCKKYSQDKEETVWGKNKPLEALWQNLATGKEVVLIYKDGTHEIIVLPKGKKKNNAKFDEFDNNPEINAVLTSCQSTDAYELLYTKAKNKSVNEVIKNYKKFFISIGPMPPVQKGIIPLMKKAMYLY